MLTSLVSVKQICVLKMITKSESIVQFTSLRNTWLNVSFNVSMGAGKVYSLFSGVQHITDYV